MERQHVPLNHEPSQTATYLQKSYWNERFAEEENYDWFKKFADFKHLVLPHLRKSDKVLVLGCGNSSLTFDLHALGYQDITSIDYSEVVIERMRERSKEAKASSLKWEVADMLALPFKDCSFDVVLEKGTMDVLFVDNDSNWQPKKEVCERVRQMLAEVHRVLRQGKFISITFAQPHFRKPFFLDKSFTWSLDCQSFGETFHYFVYTLEKGKRTDFGESKQESIAKVKMESPMHEHMDQENYLSYISL